MYYEAAIAPCTVASVSDDAVVEHLQSHNGKGYIICSQCRQFGRMLRFGFDVATLARDSDPHLKRDSPAKLFDPSKIRITNPKSTFLMNFCSRKGIVSGLTCNAKTAIVRT